MIITLSKLKKINNNVGENGELVKMETYGGCLHIVFIKLHVKGLPQNVSRKRAILNGLT